MNSLLCTGGTGFIGQWMQRLHPPTVEGVYIGRNGYNLWYWHLMQFDYLVHLANISPEKILENAVKYKTRLMYCSSGAAYDQDTEYAENKRKWEQMCLESGVDVVIARLFTFYDSAKSHVAFTNAAKANEPIIITGDGSTIRSYMHGSQMAEWMWAILLKGESGRIYDVGSDQPINMFDLATDIKKIHGSTSEIIVKGGIDPVPYYMPRDTESTMQLL
jgi:nucleoside-diphosphate-sugar epimerase